MCSLVQWQLGEALDHFRTRWDIDVMFNWVTLLLLKELIQTSVFDAHCQGREEVSSFVPAWVAHPPVRRAHAMTPLSGHQACVLWQMRMATRTAPPVMSLLHYSSRHSHSDWVRGWVSRPVWRCLRSPPNQDLSALVMYSEQCQRVGD